VIAALADTLARLDAAEAYCSVVAGPPSDDRWVAVAALRTDTTTLHGWFEQLVASGHPPDVAGSFLAGWLAEVIVRPVATSLQHERRTWPLDPDRLWLHHHADGWFDGIAIVAGRAALRRLLAADAVDVLAPLFAAVRALAPFGQRGMWGATADALASGAAYGAFRAGRATADAFGDAMALVDDMVVAGAPRLTRPTPLAVSCRHGTLIASRKGTCCLWYKLSSADGEQRYCLSCPLRDDDDQRRGFAEWLDTQSPGAAPG